MHSRLWWRNCTQEDDSEIRDIDRMEDNISPITPSISKIRELISSVELCHHKVDRWIFNIIEAIGTGETKKGLGTRIPGQIHPAEQIWLDACTALSAWSNGYPLPSINITIGTVPASQMLSYIGKHSPLKEWQVQRIIEKIRSLIHWPKSSDDPSIKYEWILFNESEDGYTYRNECPVKYKVHEYFWSSTVQTMIHNTENQSKVELPLGFAIDMLWPCHWNFMENLQITLEAIGGNLNPQKPFLICGKDLTNYPFHEHIMKISNTLKFFYDPSKTTEEVDRDMLALLKEPTEVKKWLAWSLDKTIRLQLNS